MRGSSDPTRLSAGLASWSLSGPLSGGWTLSLPPRWQTSEAFRLPRLVSQSVLLWDLSRVEMRRVARGRTRMSLLSQAVA
jgi:hypothetical protein